MDNRKFGIYPEAGGYNNQDPQILSDWALMNERYGLAYDDLKSGQSSAMDALIYGNDDDESGVMPAR